MQMVKFIDLFAGIGGTRLGLERAASHTGIQAKCVFTSEWDPHAQKTYFANFGEFPRGDIRRISCKDIPKHDILLAGFPCQPFSIAGVSKKNALNRPHGFNCKTQGTLFFEIERILKEKRPRAFLLENVKNLKLHDKGNTYKVIMQALIENCHYTVFDRIYDAKSLVPQHRERIFLVGFREKSDAENFRFPELPENNPRLGTFLQENVDRKYTLSDNLWQYLKNYRQKHQEKGNGFGYGLNGPDDVARTLSARYHKDGSEILIKQEGKNPRRLTPRECARIMGFPETFKILVSDTQAYRQFGNSVVVPVVRHICIAILRTFQKNELNQRKNLSKKSDLCATL